MTLSPRTQAGLDQVAAMLRDERKRMLKAHADWRRSNDEWWKDARNLRVLIADLIKDSSADECRRIVGWVLEKPWAYRAEFVCAWCRLTDNK